MLTKFEIINTIKGLSYIAEYHASASSSGLQAACFAEVLKQAHDVVRWLQAQPWTEITDQGETK